METHEPYETYLRLEISSVQKKVERLEVNSDAWVQLTSYRQKCINHLTNVSVTTRVLMYPHFTDPTGVIGRADLS
jgi:hypothetical protein